MSLFGKSIEINSPEEVLPHLVETQIPPVKEASWWLGKFNGLMSPPRHGLYFFETRAKLVGPENKLQKYTGGQWHSFFPHEAYTLEDSQRKLPPIHTVGLGVENSIEKLAFEGPQEYGLIIAAHGIFHYLHGDYSAEQTKELTDRANELWNKDRAAISEALDRVYDSLKNSQA